MPTHPQILYSDTNLTLVFMICGINDKLPFFWDENVNPFYSPEHFYQVYFFR